MANEKRLTGKDEIAYSAISKFIKENGYPPSVRELCKILGKSSTATIKYRLKSLEQKGFIKTTSGAKRTIRLLNGIDKTPDVEVADMREFAEDVVYQFGYYCQNDGRLHITHGGLSTLEWAFDILEWDNPHPVPECECEIEGCHEHATCGTPTADGYKRVCGRHFAKMDGDGNA
jgi:DNA-binding transcriptional regulator YhcF (GntR family)